jgi:NitT/TauT family transport system ATP-binding protein
MEERSDLSLTLGFMPLVDCTPLVVAREKGFAAAEGLSLTLVRETSWANIRDRLMIGHFDAAHMLGPMAIAATLGIGHVATPIIVPFSLSLGGNAITVSLDLFAAMVKAGTGLASGPMEIGRALARVVAQRRAEGGAPLTLAVVHPFSGHNYELRYWLAAVGMHPDRDMSIVVLPPSAMVEALIEHQIDGFCLGEPWNSRAVAADAGVIVVTKSSLWRQGPEKVLACRSCFAERSPARLAVLLRALYRAAEWAGLAENHPELCELLACPGYLAVPAEDIIRSLSGSLIRRAGAVAELIPDFLVFHAYAANFPWQSHALWYYSQMVRWGQIAYSAEGANQARQVFRPDLFRNVLGDLGVDLPRADAKVEGALTTAMPVASRNGTMILGPDGFFDGRLFDPDTIEAYLHSFDSGT